MNLEHHTKNKHLTVYSDFCDSNVEEVIRNTWSEYIVFYLIDYEENLLVRQSLCW